MPPSSPPPTTKEDLELPVLVLGPRVRRWILGMCCFMALWAIIMPGSWRVGLYESHTRVVAGAFEMGSFPQRYMALMPNILTKYASHPGVRYTHLLFAGAWALLIPLQLSSWIRAKNLNLHRWVGG